MEPTLDQLREAVRELLSARRHSDGALASVLRMEDWNDWPEAKRQAYDG